MPSEPRPPAKACSRQRLLQILAACCHDWPTCTACTTCTPAAAWQSDLLCTCWCEGGRAQRELECGEQADGTLCHVQYATALLHREHIQLGKRALQLTSLMGMIRVPLNPPGPMPAALMASMNMLASLTPDMTSSKSPMLAQ